MTTADDLSSHANDGVYVGNIRCSRTPVPTSSERGIRLDGSTSYVNVGGVRAEITNSIFCFGVWCRLADGSSSSPAVFAVNTPSGTPSNRYIVQFIFDGTDGHWEINTSTSGGVSQITSQSGDPHGRGEDMFVVANLGTSSQKLFVNGSSVASSTYTGTAIVAGDRFSIGQDFDRPDLTVSEVWRGAMADAFMLDRAATSTEVGDLYTKGATDGGYSTAVLALSGLIGHWRLNEFTNCGGPSVGFISA